MDHELTKAEKKVARRCIDKGLDAEYREGLEEFDRILHDWRTGHFASNQEAYFRLYKAVEKKDRAIGSRYNDLRGSRYLITVLGILQDGYISKEDIEGFSDKTKVSSTGG